MHYFRTIALFIALIPFISCTNTPKGRGFAIIIDPQSYQQAKSELEAYATSIEADGLKTFIIEDTWKNPDSIKSQLIKLYSQKKFPIEGAVFIGDIPIAMVRDAQHMTSAFKMDQDRYAWNRSSIPTDRFYDDFDLKFKFLKQDSLNSKLFYYALAPESTQKLQPEIYTGRIKPFNTPDKYKHLRAYLSKVVTEKQKQNTLNQVLYFGGHGYISESIIARIDEKITLLEQFPQMKQPQNNIEYIDHQMQTHIKDRLMSELQRPDLDLAILHHHGGDNTQYLNGMPKVEGTQQQINGIKMYLRSKLRQAEKKGKDIRETMRHYTESLGVPPAWFDGTFHADIIKEDSLFNARLDMVTTDVSGFVPNARFVVLDACFNGSFQLDSCIASAYIFNPGKTMVVQANSVNALQDKWSNELIGMTGMGYRVGQWSKHVAYLETHIIGDPTYRFDKSKPALPDVHTPKESKYWISTLESPHATTQALALRKLFENNYEGLSSLLLKTLKENPNSTVRMESLKLLTAYNDQNFIEALKLAITDPDEMVQRQAVYLIGKSGHPQLINAILNMTMRNNTGARLEFNIKQALSTFCQEDLLKSFSPLFDSLHHYTNPYEVKKAIEQSIEYNSGRWIELADIINDPESSDKNKKFAIRALRNMNYHPAVDAFCNFAQNGNNDKLQVMMLEALGWFNISYRKDTIIETCNHILECEQYNALVKNEALRTKNRLTNSWYR